MLLIDRILLARYHMDSFNACFAAAQWYWGFYITTLTIVSIVGVFIGQLNGAQRYTEIGSAVWQMIWFCIALYGLFFIPLTIWGIPHLLADPVSALGTPYLRILMLFLPIQCIGYGALAAFFVGRGTTKVIPVVSFFANLLNALFDIILIFGVTLGNTVIIPELGIVGAALATILAQGLSTGFLAYLFFQKTNRERYGTGNYRVKPTFLSNCLRTATPSALNSCINSLCWAAMIQVITAHASSISLQAYGMTHLIYIAFDTLIEGVAAGTRTVCANAIGGQQWSVLKYNCFAWGILMLCVVAFVGIAMLGYPEWLIETFLNPQSPDVIPFTVQMLSWAWIAFALESAVSNLLNTLTAAGDTRFTMLVNTTSFLCLTVIPTYIGVIYFHQGPLMWWYCVIVDKCMRIFCFSRRYRSGIWRQKTLIR